MPAFNLAPNEKVILLLRRHRLVLAAALAKPAVLALTPLILALALLWLKPAILTTPPWAAFFWYLSFLFWLICWCYGLLVWLDWYLDLWILTNLRIIDIEQRKLFNRQILGCSLDKIQHVATQVSGALPTFFQYGDVEIKTAAQAEPLFFKQIPQPNEVQDTILRVHQEYLKNFGGQTQT